MSAQSGDTSPRERPAWIRCSLIGILIAAVCAVCWLLRPSSPVVAGSDLVRRDGLLFVRGQTTAFSGIMVEHYRNGPVKSRSEIVDGVLHGRSEAWSPHGRLQVREWFKHGVSDGVRTKWHENGAKWSEATIVAGQIDGTFRRWHENGQLAQQIEMKQGQPDGVSLAFHPSGFIKARTVLRMGKVLEQQFWNDGELKELPARSNALSAASIEPREFSLR